MFRDHGQSKKYYHNMIGWNARMDGIQGAVLNVKLKHLAAWNEDRRKNAKQYDELLSDINGLVRPVEADYAKHVYHVYAVQVLNREKLIAALAEKDIYCGIHYPVPVHLQDAYNMLKIKSDSCVVAEACADKLISFPMYPELSFDQQKKIRDEIQRFF